MSTIPSLRPDEVRCWGRGEELAYLLNQVEDKPRSITLVHGESAIGKYSPQ